MAATTTGPKLNDFFAEEVIPIRSSLLRMVSGQRPQSYNLRIAFKIRGESAVQIRRGLIRALASHPMLRTTLTKSNDGAAWHTVKSPESYSELIEEHTVGSEAEATRLREQTPAAAASPTFMFKADLIAVRGADHHYLSLTYNHSVVDALTLIAWHQDVDRCIGDDALHGASQTSYKLFSDLLVQYDSSQLSQVSIAYHVQRLRGILRLRQSLWPQQRAPGWMIASDEESEHAKARAAARETVWKGSWKNLGHEFQFPRRSRVVRLAHLGDLQQHGISPAILAQSAIIIFNFIQTRSQHAIFTTWESGRSWPFVPDWMSSTLPSASSINGPTFQWMLNVFEMVNGETIAAFLKRIALESQETQKHVHAPWDKVVAGLREEGDVAEDASFRQSFVWDASIGLGTSLAYKSDYKVLEPIERYDWADCGFVWSAFMEDKQQMRVMASWDTAQLNASEVDDYCDSVAGILTMLDDAKNWDKCIEEVFTK